MAIDQTNFFFPSYVLALTTDSGSNNFTMANEMAMIFLAATGTDWDVQQNHHRCICHVIALILGAGLKALNVSKKMVRPEKANKPFPFLTPIIEGDEPGLDNDVVGEEVNSDDEEVDPDDATPDVMADGWEEPNPNNDDEATGEDSENPIGIAFTLKKAEWKVWAAKLGFTGRGVINGYGIRWNIAYESRQRAYEGRRVIKQLIENENDRLAGKSAKDHFFKSYELSSNDFKYNQELTIGHNVPQEFLEMTKRMEGNWPIVSMVIYEYVRLIDSLEKKMAVAAGSSLEAMYPPMIRITKKYLKIALKCDSIVMATFLHPAWRMMLFSKRLEPPMTRRITELINNNQKPPTPPPKASESDANPNSAESSDSEGDEFNFYPTNEAADNVVNTELERYNNGDFPMDKKGKLLGWWKAHAKDFPVMASLAQDYHACAASSATVERTFSAAADVCASGRTGLAICTIERCISSHMWLCDGVPMEGKFADCQGVLDAAKESNKFKKRTNEANRRLNAAKTKK
ncbi:hypothetical protein PSTT_03773 [Puccinia striiformis]|uniref:HAT C-terminal dimerisation domain-containing protein n=1 Tax=Puccinia striiformis TaxID=27350 RepID=A0A2S4VV99_9BASI|nr:hypothetical protein PSTT_03773 [Puccinia striiformis]